MTKSHPGRLFALVAGLCLAACAPETSLPDSLGDPELLPAAVRTNTAGFCQAALERHRPFAPDLVARAGAMLDSPTGDFPASDKATCFFAVEGDETAWVTFAARCADPTDASCVIPLAISIGEEGWMNEEYAAELQRRGRVERLAAPGSEANQ